MAETPVIYSDNRRLYRITGPGSDLPRRYCPMLCHDCADTYGPCTPGKNVQTWHIEVSGVQESTCVNTDWPNVGGSQSIPGQGGGNPATVNTTGDINSTGEGCGPWGGQWANINVGSYTQYTGRNCQPETGGSSPFGRGIQLFWSGGYWNVEIYHTTHRACWFQGFFASNECANELNFTNVLTAFGQDAGGNGWYTGNFIDGVRQNYGFAHGIGGALRATKVCDTWY